MNATLKHYFADYGMVVVLILLGIYYSWVTWEEQHPTGPAAASGLADRMVAEHGSDASILIATRANAEDKAFSQALRENLKTAGCTIIAEAPLSELQNFSTELKSITAGSGSYTMEYSHDENTPPHVQQEVIAAFEGHDHDD